MRLMHATILITGGSSGIGLELARQLLARDNTVIIVGRRPEPLEAAQARLPDLHIAVCDVSRPAAVAELFDELAPAFPALNVLVNCAGGMQRLDLLADRGSPELTAEIDVNLKGAMWMVARFLPLLKTQPQAAIVNDLRPRLCAAGGGTDSQRQQGRLSRLHPRATRATGGVRGSGVRDRAAPHRYAAARPLPHRPRSGPFRRGGGAGRNRRD